MMHHDRQGTNFERFTDELHSDGISDVAFDTASLDQLAAVFEKLPIPELFSRTTGHICEVAAGSHETAKFVVAHTAVTERMRWLWACDEATLRLFDAASLACTKALSHAIGASVSLYAACFVVVLGPELTEAEVKEHKDWGHPRLREGESFTCLAPLTALPASVGRLHAWPWQRNDYVHGYQFGRYVVIDGKLLHRTEPFSYLRDADAVTCDKYEASGHLRVLVSLSIASDEVRLAPYVNKVLRGMAPAAALVRGHPEVYLDSQSEQWTSDEDASESGDDSDHGADALRGIGSILQNGLWRGELCSLDSQVTPFELELAFDLDEGTIYNGSRSVGLVEASLSTWHAGFSLERDDGRIQATGEFVRTPVSVLLQGRCRMSDGTFSNFGLLPPAPWRVELREWERLQLPKRVLPVPPDPGAIEVKWSAGPRIQAGVAAGRAARWLHSNELDAQGPAVVLDALGTDHELSCLSAGSVVVVPETIQRDCFFDELMMTACKTRVSAVILIDTCSRRLPRAGRQRAIDRGDASSVFCVTISSTALRAAGMTQLSDLQGLQFSVTQPSA
eukprot:TRINITY_DN7130_c0_g2_i1.p1 TRINITY_DN7130_c0_g2~~TRINITY_DN7130_c0_g2_i1.p1  ORF type:complete len:562 (-),score=68.19 TRINITY_DN7130_c0_g2_i1:91-1776(-)